MAGVAAEFGSAGHRDGRGTRVQAVIGRRPGPDHGRGGDRGRRDRALGATAATHTQFVTGIVALTKPARLLDVVPGRTAMALSAWVFAQSEAWRANVRAAALDPFRGYATALHTGLPDAVRVLDAFHVVKVGFDAVDQVRRRVQQETTGHRGRKQEPLYGIRRLLRRFDHHSVHSWQRMLARLETGDPDAEDAHAWIAAQELLLNYADPTGHGPSVACWRGSPGSPSTRSPSCCGWPGPWMRGSPNCWPTSTPAGSRTDLPRR